MGKITIVVIDAPPLFQQGVVDVFSLENDFEIVGQANNGEDGLEMIRDLRPNVAIVDVNLPGLNGHKVARQVVVERIPTRVVLLTAYDDQEQVIHAMRAGSSAYCSKDIEPENLVDIIRWVNEGKYVVGDDVFDQAGMETWMAEFTEHAIRPYRDRGEPL